MDKFNVPLAIDAQVIGNALASAFHGGINYWCARLDVHGSRQDAQRDLPKDWDLGLLAWIGVSGTAVGYHLILCECPDGLEDNEVCHALTHAKLVTGLVKLASDFPKVFGRVLANEADANDADVYVQLCIFGEVKYG